MYDGLMKAAITALVAALTLTACPPPGTPPPLPGNPSWTGQQRLSVFIGSGSTIIACHLFHDAVWDLGYQTVRVTAKTSASGECLSNQWTDRRAIATCNIGTVVGACGVAMALPVSATYASKFFGLSRLPQNGRFRTTFQATLHYAGQLFPVAVTGDTPFIRCSVELKQCKFQG